MDYLDLLNPEQRAAVEHSGKPLLILAGAGSGKTRVITTKIAYLIREKGVDPRSILAVTFTNKAAREMRERACRIDVRAEDAMLRTFHSFGAWFLRRNGGVAGLPSNFNIYDDDDSAALLAGIMAGAPKAEVRRMAHRIARAKDYFLNPDNPELPVISERQDFREVYAKYEAKLHETGNVDFGDLIKKPVEILRGNPAIKSRFQDRFRVIMVDEYQDANVAQFELLRELYVPGVDGAGTYICVVGDDDQSIYSFRGAEVQNILQFPSKFDGVDTIRLVRNYRSTSPILDLANTVVRNNRGRLGKELSACREGGRLPRLVFVEDQETEAAFCAHLIERTVDSGKCGYDAWALLYRTNAQSLSFETEFLRRGIPYRVVGSLKFYEREEIKDALSLLALLFNPRDEVAFKRIVNKPARGLGGKAIDRVVEAAGGGSLLEALADCADGFSAKARRGAEDFLAVFDKARALLKNVEADVDNEDFYEDADQAAFPFPAPQNTPSAASDRGALRYGEGLSRCAAFLAIETGLAAYHQENDEVKGESRLDNLQELINAAALYSADAAGLSEFLEHIELDRSAETGDTGEAVTLITVHNTKGLEFKRVILTGVEQGIFPRWDKTGADLEEERRLFYVGVTRAMDELYLTCAQVRRVFGRFQPSEPSVFLHEAREADIQEEGDAPFNWRRRG